MLHPAISMDEGVCAPLETEMTINLRRQQSFKWDATVCSFATIWKALHSLFELKQLAERKPRPADKLVVLAVCKPRPADKLEESAERKPIPAGKLIVLAEHKPRPADKIGFADRKSRPAGNVQFAEHKPRPAGNLYWELLVAAIGCSAKDSGSDFLLWHSPQV
jgi:hypothetical protein